MTCEQAWTLFFATGLPEAYSLFGLMRDGGRTECAPTRDGDGGRTECAITRDGDGGRTECAPTRDRDGGRTECAIARDGENAPEEKTA